MGLQDCFRNPIELGAYNVCDVYIGHVWMYVLWVTFNSWEQHVLM